ncbi:MAG TPA: PAS domain S-box protein, partial [Chitinophagales bacterium]|nr:PAS domain S-box protein [Chitinophagales bacterium]
MSRSTLQKMVTSPPFIGVVMFLVLMGLTQYLSYGRYLHLRDAEMAELNNEANAAEERIQTVLSYNLATAQTLGFIVEKYGVPTDFDSVGATLLRSNKFADAVQLVQGGVITHTYPLKGNEAVIGYNILKDSVRNSGAFTAIESGNFFWAGPIPLKQGGVGIVGRQPLYKDGAFYGFSAVIIRLGTFLQGAGIDTTGVGIFSYQLSRVNADNTQEFFLSSTRKTENARSVPVQIPNAEWRLYVMRKSGPAFYTAAAFSLLGFILSLTGGLFAWFMARQPAKLNELVRQKTTQLAASEQYYRALIEKSSDAIVLINRSGKIIYQSPSTTVISGYVANELEGVDSLALIYPDDQQADSDFFDNLCAKPGASATRMHRFRHKNGKYTWIEGTYTNLLNDKSVNAVVFNYHDITGRIKAQQEILREKNLSESIINSLPGVFYLYDSNGKFLKWNRNFELVTGYTAQEIQAMHPLDFFQGDEKELLSSKIAAVFTEGKAEVEAPFSTKDGRKLDYFFNGHLTRLDGSDYLIGMGIDITERKKAEREIVTERNLSASIINSLPGIFYLADFNGRLLRWNKNFETVSGYSAQEIQEMRVIQFVHTD